MPVYDRSYRRWEGKLERGPRWVPVASAGILQSLRRRKSWILTGVFYLFLLASVLPFLFLLVANFLYFFPPEVLFLQSFISVLGDMAPYKVVQYPGLLWLTDVFVMIYVVIFGSGLIARDRAALALPLYLSRPMVVRDYIIGKFAIIAFFLSVLTLFPCLLLWFMDVIGAEDEGKGTRQLRELGGVMLHAGSLVTVYSFTILAASSVCRRSMVAGILWFGIVTVCGILATSLDDGLGVPHISAISMSRAALSLAYPVYDLEMVRTDIPGGAQVLDGTGIQDYTDPWVALGVLVAYCLGSLFIIRQGIRKQGF